MIKCYPHVLYWSTSFCPMHASPPSDYSGPNIPKLPFLLPSISIWVSPIHCLSPLLTQRSSESVLFICLRYFNKPCLALSIKLYLLHTIIALFYAVTPYRINWTLTICCSVIWFPICPPSSFLSFSRSKACTCFTDADLSYHVSECTKALSPSSTLWPTLHPSLLLPFFSPISCYITTLLHN